jgi:ketosteroid isomerase-like protein
MKQSKHPLTHYLTLLSDGDSAALLDLFSAEPQVDDPQFGRITADTFPDYVTAASAWLQQRRARVETVALTYTSTRAVAEQILHLEQDGKAIPLPIALVGEMDGEKLTAVRLYHSLWPLIGGHRVRPPLLPTDHNLVMPDVIGRYQDALARGDLEVILQTFEDDAIAREPSGGEYKYKGMERLREFYGMLFSQSGGILLQHCTVTDDSIRCAVEYNVTAWGDQPLPPQAGVAVYERGKSGLLAAARIYDDVDPPL